MGSYMQISTQSVCQLSTDPDPNTWHLLSPAPTVGLRALACAELPSCVPLTRQVHPILQPAALQPCPPFPSVLGGDRLLNAVLDPLSGHREPAGATGPTPRESPLQACRLMPEGRSPSLLQAWPGLGIPAASSTASQSGPAAPRDPEEPVGSGCVCPVSPPGQRSSPLGIGTELGQAVSGWDHRSYILGALWRGYPERCGFCHQDSLSERCA